MSLVNISLKLWSLNMAYTLIFLLKKNVSSCHSGFDFWLTCQSIRIYTVCHSVFDFWLTCQFIRIYSVCHSVFEFWLTCQFATMVVSKSKDGTMHIRDLGVKGLKTISHRTLKILSSLANSNHSNKCKVNPYFMKQHNIFASFKYAFYSFLLIPNAL